MSSTVTKTEQIPAEKLETLIHLHKKIRKYILIYGSMFFITLLLLIGDIYLMATYVKSLFSTDSIIPLLVAILFFRIVYLSGKIFSFYSLKNRLTKKDLKENTLNTTTGTLEGASFNARHIILNFGDKIVAVNLSSAFLGYHVYHFAIMLNQRITISYLPNSGLLYSLAFHDILPNKTSDEGSTRPGYKKLSGMVTMITVYKFSVRLKFQTQTYYEKKLQLGNKLLFWYKNEFPEIGSPQEILVKE